MAAEASRLRISRAAPMPSDPGRMISSRYRVNRSWAAASSSGPAPEKVLYCMAAPRFSRQRSSRAARALSCSGSSSQTAI